ncbi:MAG: fructose-6-phosphate aldolase [Armatimonadota bacterium]
MKIFLDTANIEDIRTACSWGIIDGVTTNPSLVSKEKKDFKEVITEICDICKGPVSAEAVSMDAEGIIKEARQLSKWSENVVVKVPMTKEGIKATSVLSKENIKTNVTLVFSANQALLACKAGATYISPFVGRIDDTGWNGIDLLYEIIPIIDTYGFKTEVISASIRHPQHVVESAKAGAHIATIPYKIVEQMFKHPLTDIGIQKFMEDWKKVPAAL